MNRCMDWLRLLSHERLGSSRQSPRRRHRPPWQQDFDRITFASAFRRLQDKTQVFPLSSSDYVRTRLTHSMEAATVARNLGNYVGFRLEECGAESGFPAEVHPLEIGMICAAAALAHDIGNPPFGHSGEDAIRHWFHTSPSVQRHCQELSPLERADFELFEGNAQGFRILAHLQMYAGEGGMRLTAATLGAFTKYPAEAPLGNGGGPKKFGFFQADKDRFQELAANLGLLRLTGERCAWARHPLALLVEAADDICYRLVDLEDAAQQKLVPFEIVKAKLESVAQPGERNAASIGSQSPREQIKNLRGLAIGRAIEACVGAFIEAHPRIMEGTLTGSLISHTEFAAPFADIEALQREHVYTNDRVLRVEAAGYDVIGGLAEVFFESLSEGTGGAGSSRSRKLLALLPKEEPGLFQPAASSPYHRLLRVTDYICGMTDSYALELYRNIAGISLP
jgi:dGTPase